MTLAPDPVLLDVSPSGAAILTLNRPAHRNGFNAALVGALIEALETLRAADHVRIVFVRGAGHVFCAGPEFEWLEILSLQSRGDVEAHMLDYARVARALHELPQFTVALVQGGAHAEGAVLVAACDYAVAVRETTFSFPESRFGYVSAGAPFLVEAVGARNARALLSSGMPIDAQRAYDMGLLSRVVPDAEALESVMREFGGRLLESAPSAIDASKRLVRESANRKLDDAAAHHAANRAAQSFVSPDSQDGVAARLQKRPPPWD